MSNHFTGLSLGPPMGDQRLDLCDLYAFQSPADASKTVIILNANPEANGFHPDAIYRLNIDNDGDCLTDIAISYTFSAVDDGKQTANVFVARGDDARSPEALGEKIVADAEVSFGKDANVIEAGDYRFFFGARSDAFFFDLDGFLGLFDTDGGRNFTAPHDGGQAPWTGTDSNAEADVFSTVVELPTSEIAGDSPIGIWGRCSVRNNGELTHADRAGHPSMSSFFNADDTKEEYNASEPAGDRDRWLDQFVHLLGHTGDYTRDEAITAIDAEGLLPDVLTFDPSQAASYPNGRTLTDDVLNNRLSFISKGDIPHDGLRPHTDLLGDFPYIGVPHLVTDSAEG